MESKAKLFGHPLHQQLVALPVGMLVLAVLCDIAGLVSGQALPHLLAYWAMAGGIIFATIAAVFGIIDLTAVPARTRAARIGWMHGVGNTVVLVLFMASWVLRRASEQQQPTTIALMLSFVAAGVLLVTGWLGGELVSRLGVGVSDGAGLNASSSLDKQPEGARAAAAAPSPPPPRL